MAGLQERYEAAWGKPVDAVTYSKDTMPGQEFRAMAFLPEGSRVGRVASHGLSSCTASDGQRLGIELLFAVDAEYVRAHWGRIADFLADVSVHLLKHAIRPREGDVLPETSLAPWPLDALVYDLPRGEPEEFECFTWDGKDTHLIWAIPVYRAEAALVKAQGIAAFDALVEESEYSLADVLRPSLVIS